MPLQVKIKENDGELESDAMLNGNFNVERLFDVKQDAFDSGVQRHFEGTHQATLNGLVA